MRMTKPLITSTVLSVVISPDCEVLESSGYFVVAPTGNINSAVGGAGVCNSVPGDGSAAFAGTFNIDISGANTTPGDTWMLATNGVICTYTKSTGSPSVCGSGPTNDYDVWGTNYPALTGSDALGAADPDGDGFINSVEFALDCDPTVDTPALLWARPAGGGEVVFDFVARRDQVSAYTVLSTTNPSLGNRRPDTEVVVTDASDQSGALLPAEYVHREFLVPVGLKKFFRIRADFTGQ